MKKKYKVGVAGATGLVGKALLKLLEERDFPIQALKLFASEQSQGKKIPCSGEVFQVEPLSKKGIRDLDLLFTVAGGEVSRDIVPQALELGVQVVDNSSIFRMDQQVPLIVPEVNPEDLALNQGVIANPNCSTIQCMLPLKALQRHYGLKRVIYSSYQSVSGSGMRGLRDLDERRNEFYPCPIHNNVIPHIDSFMEDGYTKEEIKMMEETRKILHQPKLAVTATTVRVPVRFAHCVSVNVELEADFDLEEMKTVLATFPHIRLLDDPSRGMYPTPHRVEGSDLVWVGRLRRDFSLERAINLWVVADNIRKGAATNAIQIGELWAGGHHA